MRSFAGILVLFWAQLSIAQPRDSSRLDSILLGRRVSLGAAFYNASYGYRGGSFGSAVTTQQVDAHWRFGGFTTEAGVRNAIPTASSAASFVNGTARAGWTFDRITATGGVVVQYAATAQPSMQLLPSVSAAWASGDFGISAALFDLDGLAPLRVSFEHEHFAVGYVAPVGAHAVGRVALGQAWRAQLQLMWVKSFNAQVLYAGLSGTFDFDRSTQQEAR